MATSGSFNTTSNGNFYWTFEWYRKSYNSEKSTSPIHYKVVAHNAQGSYRSVWEKNVKVAGDVVFSQPGSSSSKTTYYDGDVVCEGDYTLQHDSSGNCTFSASAAGGVGSYPGTNISGSGSWTVDTIPRYTQVYANVTSVGLNTIGVKWTTDDNVSVIQYRLNGGSWVDVETNINKKSGNFTISGLSPNTTYNIDLDAKRRDSGLWSFSADKGASFSRTTKDIARISNYNKTTNLGDSYSVKYTNPSGEKIQVGIYDSQGKKYYAEYRTVTGSSYTFNFTDAELDSMYKAMGKANSLSAKLYINTDENAYRESKEITINLTGNQKTARINVNNSWRRAKRWVNVNGTYRRAVRWTNVNGTWKRCI